MARTASGTAQQAVVAEVQDVEAVERGEIVRDRGEPVVREVEHLELPELRHPARDGIEAGLGEHEPARGGGGGGRGGGDAPAQVEHGAAQAAAFTPLRSATSATMSRMIRVRSKSFGV
jgi:hypothetical protein